ncbi:DBH-like monooxygenase protein 2, partial [Orchesella cincta]
VKSQSSPISVLNRLVPPSLATIPRNLLNSLGSGVLSFPPPRPVGTTPPIVQFRRREVLNETLGYIVEWEVNRNTRTVVFNISVETTAVGYLVFGLGRREQVAGADVVVGGVGSDGQSFLVVKSLADIMGFLWKDMYGEDNSTIVRDTRQNWQLLRAESTSGGLRLSVSRLFDTCDEQDLEMNNDLTYILWGYGNSSESESINNSIESVQFSPLGITRAYLLDPIVNTTRSDSQLQTWRVSRTFQLPPRHTSYWCTIHRGNRFASKQHVVGYSGYFGNEISEKHVHHQIVYRCTPPPVRDASTYFEQFIGHPGEECYVEDVHAIPTNLCLEIVGMWGVGQRGFEFPETVGFPIGEAPNEYFMLETHYDNPDERSDLVVENGFEFMYTPNLRQTEGSLVFIGTSPLGLYMVPPQSQNFKVVGTCNSYCTSSMIPLGGMEILGTILHSHMTTQQIRFRHFRGNTELPWISNDDNYSYSFQRFRVLSEPVRVLPGDNLATECSMSTTNKNRTTLSGFSTNDEMCVTFVLVNRDLPFLYCTSEYNTQTTMAKYGIRNMTWDRELQARVINDAVNPIHNGQTFSDFVESNIEWTPQERAQVEQEQYNGVHQVFCPNVRNYAMIGHAALGLNGLTRDLFDLDGLMNENRPTTRSVSTPLPNGNVMFPGRASIDENENNRAPNNHSM